MAGKAYEPLLKSDEDAQKLNGGFKMRQELISLLHKLYNLDIKGESYLYSYEQHLEETDVLIHNLKDLCDKKLITLPLTVSIVKAEITTEGIDFIKSALAEKHSVRQVSGVTNFNIGNVNGTSVIGNQKDVNINYKIDIDVDIPHNEKISFSRKTPYLK